MRNMNLQDERIVVERRQIQSKGYAWLVIILFVAIIVQAFFLRVPFQQYAVELFILLGCGCYNSIANYQKGIDIWNSKNHGVNNLLISTLISGALSVILFALLSANYRPQSFLFYFIFFVIFMFATRLVMTTLTRKKQKRIDKELNDDDKF
ncbi:DUF6773 family protein [Enterococcus sp. LJL90]